MASNESSSRAGRRPLRIVLWVVAVVVAVVLALTAYLVIPIVTGGEAGSSGQAKVEGYPLTVQATGDDGRTRTLSVDSVDGSDVDLSQVSPGDQIVVTGSGFDASLGIYVAVCKVPDSVDRKPGPCLGGVPDIDAEQIGAEGHVQWAASNWINDDWAWRLFGARSFDDRDAGTFTAYVLVPESSDEFVDCVIDTCAIYTRNDHTAIDNRVQDLYLPVSFSE
jgi:hypothetical protein